MPHLNSREHIFGTKVEQMRESGCRHDVLDEDVVAVALDEARAIEDQVEPAVLQERTRVEQRVRIAATRPEAARAHSARVARRERVLAAMSEQLRVDELLVHSRREQAPREDRTPAGLDNALVVALVLVRRRVAHVHERLQLVRAVGALGELEERVGEEQWAGLALGLATRTPSDERANEMREERVRRTSGHEAIGEHKVALPAEHCGWFGLSHENALISAEKSV